MRQVQLQKLYLHHFKSFVQPTEIALPATAGLKFLGGRNEVEPRLGSNGSGKSTLWDALCWSLFGAGVRGQRAAELTSWGHAKPHVVATLLVDGEEHRIDRRGSPNRLEIDGVPATQEDVELLLQLSKDRFLQAVVLGQGAPLFLDLSSAARSELLDGVLALGEWSAASDRAGRQASLLARDVADLERQVAYEEGRLAGAPGEAAVQARADAWKTEQQAQLAGIIAEVEAAETESEVLQQRINATEESLAGLDDPENLLGGIEALRAQLRLVATERERLELFSRDICPTCGRAFGDDHARHAIQEAEEAIADAGDLQVEVDRLIGWRSEVIYRQRLWEQSVRQNVSALAQRTSQISALEQQAERLAGQENPYTRELEDLRQVRAAAEAKIAELREQRTTYAGSLELAQFWQREFKSVRLWQVQRVLARMGLEVANVATSLGIGGWTIEFVTEVETKAGTTRPGIQVLVKTPQYSGTWTGFSGGESQRIRLAVTLGLASMIQALAGVSVGFLVLDEASQFLSVEGVEDLLTCLQARAETTQKSIYISDHTTLAFSGFDEVLYCIKDLKGSRIEKHANGG